MLIVLLVRFVQIIFVFLQAHQVQAAHQAQVQVAAHHLHHLHHLVHHHLVHHLQVVVEAAHLVHHQVESFSVQMVHFVPLD